MDNFFGNQTDEQLQYIRDAITNELERRKNEIKPKEEPKVLQDDFSKRIFELYCKGMITEEEMEEKIKNRK